MQQWDALVEKYSGHMRARGLALATIEMRARELLRFGAWLRTRRPRPTIEEVDADLIVRYVKGRSAFHSRGTVASVVSALKCMGEFLVQEGVWLKSPLRWMKGPKMDPRRHLPRGLSRAQQQALWAAAEARREDHARYQAICALSILYATGLRRGELERLDLEDWDREASVLRIDGRKTGTMRHVPVGEGVWRCIEAYLPFRHNRLEAVNRLEEPALLVNRAGERMTGLTLWLLLRRLAKDAGIERVTPHQFRHSCATDLLEAGVHIPEVQRILGHAVLQSTLRYAAITDPERTAAISKHPINGFIGPPADERRAS